MSGQKQYGAYEEKTFSFKDDPKSTVTVREASWKSDLERSKLWAGTELVYDDAQVGETKQITHVSRAEVIATEIYLTFTDSTLLGQDGEKLFTPGMNKRFFMAALGQLPSALVYEWHEFVREVMPDWGMKSKNEED